MWEYIAYVSRCDERCLSTSPVRNSHAFEFQRLPVLNQSTRRRNSTASHPRSSWSVCVNCSIVGGWAHWKRGLSRRGSHLAARPGCLAIITAIRYGHLHLLGCCTHKRSGRRTVRVVLRPKDVHFRNVHRSKSSWSCCTYLYLYFPKCTSQYYDW